MMGKIADKIKAQNKEDIKRYYERIERNAAKQAKFSGVLGPVTYQSNNTMEVGKMKNCECIYHRYDLFNVCHDHKVVYPNSLPACNQHRECNTTGISIKHYRHGLTFEQIEKALEG